jgi:phage-related protein
MGNNPLIRATGVGAVLQVVMVVAGHFMPSLMDAGLFPIGGTAIGGLTGVLAALWQKGAPMGKSVGGGALAGGVAGVLGTVVSVLLGDVPASTVAIAGGSTVGAGAIGALIGRALGKGGSPTAT